MTPREEAMRRVVEALKEERREWSRCLDGLGSSVEYFRLRSATNAALDAIPALPAEVAAMREERDAMERRARAYEAGATKLQGERDALRAENERLRSALRGLEEQSRREGLDDQAEAIAAILGDTP